MVIEYAGLLGMIGVGLAASLVLSALASRLRRGGSSARSASAGLEADAALQPNELPGPTTSRYFTLAVVGTMLHAGSFYFYLWGASVRSAGLLGVWVMLAFGFCLIVGVFYAWALGAVSHSDAPAAATQTTPLAE